MQVDFQRAWGLPVSMVVVLSRRSRYADTPMQSMAIKVITDRFPDALIRGTRVTGEK